MPSNPRYQFADRAADIRNRPAQHGVADDPQMNNQIFNPHTGGGDLYPSDILPRQQGYTPTQIYQGEHLRNPPLVGFQDGAYAPGFVAGIPFPTWNMTPGNRDINVEPTGRIPFNTTPGFNPNQQTTAAPPQSPLSPVSPLISGLRNKFARGGPTPMTRGGNPLPPWFNNRSAQVQQAGMDPYDWLAMRSGQVQQGLQNMGYPLDVYRNSFQSRFGFPPPNSGPPPGNPLPPPPSDAYPGVAPISLNPGNGQLSDLPTPPPPPPPQAQAPAPAAPAPRPMMGKRHGGPVPMATGGNPFDTNFTPAQLSQLMGGRRIVDGNLNPVPGTGVNGDTSNFGDPNFGGILNTVRLGNGQNVQVLDQNPGGGGLGVGAIEPFKQQPNSPAPTPGPPAQPPSTGPSNPTGGGPNVNGPYSMEMPWLPRQGIGFGGFYNPWQSTPWENDFEDRYGRPQRPSQPPQPHKRGGYVADRDPSKNRFLGVPSDAYEPRGERDRGMQYDLWQGKRYGGQIGTGMGRGMPHMPSVNRMLNKMRRGAAMRLSKGGR